MRKRRAVGRIYGKNTVKRAIKTEIETRTDQKGVGKLGWSVKKTETTTSPPHEGEPAGTPVQERDHEHRHLRTSVIRSGALPSQTYGDRPSGHHMNQLMYLYLGDCLLERFTGRICLICILRSHR